MNPWKVERVLPPSAAAVERDMQRRSIEHLLTTALPEIVRNALMRFDEEVDKEGREDWTEQS